MIRRPMEKSVGQFEHGTGRSTIYVVRQLACVQRKACWIVGANSSCRCEGWKNWGKGGGTHLVLDADAPRLMCISSPNLLMS